MTGAGAGWRLGSLVAGGLVDCTGDVAGVVLGVVAGAGVPLGDGEPLALVAPGRAWATTAERPPMSATAPAANQRVSRETRRSPSSRSIGRNRMGGGLRLAACGVSLGFQSGLPAVTS
jgi:hypothetical protein